MHELHLPHTGNTQQKAEREREHGKAPVKLSDYGCMINKKITPRKGFSVTRMNKM